MKGFEQFLRIKMISKTFGLLLTVILLTQSCVIPQQAGLSENRSLWQKSGIKNYRMMVDLQIYGYRPLIGKFIISVRQGRAESIKHADTGELVAEPELFEKYDTVEKIFSLIEAAEKRSPDKFEVEYEPKLGYPKKVNLDYSFSGSDDEFSFRVSQFEVLE